ncbi:hypothetical protein [Paenibacillus sp. 1001270B_150601_E10]|uniref:hypothetical protein n=1 Tax=Paenibacillus sp. 1001270B_150601_E10 TaxID=2787079 RepID=UPI001E36D718|nr:hypothetical protein [Paenibacillus sp. 1001270B_150601_E10]
MRSRDSHVPSQPHVDPKAFHLEDLWQVPTLSGLEPQAADRGKEKEAASDTRSANQPPPPPRHCMPPRRRPLTVQKTALIAALLYEWLIIESVIVSRSKSVQVILGGDFTKLGLTPEMLFNQEIDQGLGLFEALEDAAIVPDITAAEETAAVEEAERKSGRDPKRKHNRSNRRKPLKTTKKLHHYPGR